MRSSDHAAGTQLSDPATVMSAPTSMRTAVVIYNPIKVDLDALKAAVGREERAAGWSESSWIATSEDDPGQGAAAEAISAGASMVIAAGGDGTVRAIAEGLRDSSIPIALLPAGTGNLLARNLKLTLDDLEDAIHTAFHGDDHRVDLGLIDIDHEDRTASTHAFLVMAGLGLDAKMLANTDDDLKKKAGWLAYAQALSLTLRDKNELRLRYNLNGGTTGALRAHTLIVGNCGALPAKIVLLPDAQLDDGEFDVVVMRPKGLIGWVQIFGKVLWENGVLNRTKAGRALMTKEVSALRYVRATELKVDLLHTAEIELDGDGFGRTTGFTTRIMPGGLTVKVPTNAERD
ncbi:MAG TPA: diacylglycerol kinase family protein [Galbitalea sp.]